MSKRSDHNFKSIMIYTVMVYIILTPFLFLYGVMNFIGVLSLFCLSLLIGGFFGFLNSIIIELRKLNGEKFPHLEDQKEVTLPNKEGTIALLSDISNNSNIYKPSLIGNKIHKIYPQQVNEHKQFHPSDLSPAQQEKFDKWKSELPKAHTKEGGIFHYIYSHGSGIGWSLTIRRGKTNKFEIDLTEYETW